MQIPPAAPTFSLSLFFWNGGKVPPRQPPAGVVSQYFRQTLVAPLLPSPFLHRLLLPANYPIFLGTLFSGTKQTHNFGIMPGFYWGVPAATVTAALETMAAAAVVTTLHRRTKRSNLLAAVIADGAVEAATASATASFQRLRHQCQANLRAVAHT